jgi:hypothetical protein
MKHVMCSDVEGKRGARERDGERERERERERQRDPDTHAYLLLPVGVLPPGQVVVAVVELHKHAGRLERGLNGPGGRGDTGDDLLRVRRREDPHDDSLQRRDSGRQHETLVVAVHHDAHADLEADTRTRCT